MSFDYTAVNASQNDHRFRKAMGVTDRVRRDSQIKHELGAVNLRIPLTMKINNCRLSQKFGGGLCAKGHSLFAQVLIQNKTGDGKDEVVHTTATVACAFNDWVDWREVLEVEYASTGYQAFLLNVIHHGKGCFAGGEEICGQTMISIPIMLNELLGKHGANPVKRFPLMLNGQETGEIYIGFKTALDVLSESTELLLYSLLANYRQHPDCLQAATTMMTSKGSDLNIGGWRDNELNTLLHTAAHVVVPWQVIDMLIDIGKVDLCALNSRKQTALMRACDSTEVVDGSNFDLACHLALRMGDVRSLYDAVEMAENHGMLPPRTLEAHVRPWLQQTMKLLIDKLHAMLASPDADVLTQAIELTQALSTKDSVLARHVNDQVAVRRLVAIQLVNAMNNAGDREGPLKAALMSAKQHRMEDMPEFHQANDMLMKIMSDKMVKALGQQLHNAIAVRDLNLLDAAIQAAGRLGHGDMEEVRRAKSSIEEVVVENLGIGIALEDETLMRRALQNADRFHMQGHAKYREAQESLASLPLVKAIIAMKEASNLRDEWKIRRAINMALDVGGDIETTREFRETCETFRDMKGFPDNWDIKTVLARDVWKPEMSNAGLVATIQQLLDLTFIKKYTRDRKGGEVPQGLIVEKVVQVQAPEIYLNYMARRQAIFTVLDADYRARTGLKKYNTHDSDGCKTFKAVPSWKQVPGVMCEPVDPAYNEFYLWHGTRPEAAEAITSGDFRVDLAGSHAGTLYGRGIYFAEASSKSDEYTEDDANGLRPLILCRVVCGRINYNDDGHPDVSKLVESCTSGSFHSVLGDREKIRNTYREFIVYDNDQAYPEYIVWYKRKMK
eukprot:GEMP01007079.1.p1 GENE.GEMP01007079.1~~GEMP01007079.1.p1  ORF type:complete len:841 (+),score=183.34 GEMP01007079.1:60-2582(+)